MRSRFEWGQVVQAGFELGRIAVTQRVNGCYCAPARSERLWRFGESRVSQRKDDESRDKVSIRAGKDTKAWARRMKPSVEPAMLK